MLVARTDPDAPKHKGLTYFLMDMEQDEVEVRPLRQITGEAEFNELFIENAYVPDENVVGGVGNGWMVAITTLMNERAGPRRLGGARPRERARRADRAGQGARPRRRPARPRQGRPPEDRHRGPAARRDARADRDDEGRHPGPGGLDRQAPVVLDQPGADRARARGRRRRDAQQATTSGPTASCAPGPTRSRAAPATCSRTSSPSASSACPKLVR